MLQLEELKTALEHDAAQRTPTRPATPDLPTVRRLMLDTVLAIEEADLTLMRERPIPVERIAAALGVCMDKLKAARTALTAHECPVCFNLVSDQTPPPINACLCIR